MLLHAIDKRRDERDGRIEKGKKYLGNVGSHFSSPELSPSSRRVF